MRSRNSYGFLCHEVKKKKKKKGEEKKEEEGEG
jgi:hypothetical protein